MTSVRNLSSIIVLVIIYLTFVTCKTCPYDVAECSCISRSVTCYKLQSIPPLQTGTDVSEIEEATFLGENINSIPSNALPPGLIILEITDNQLTNISDDAFLASADSLRVLSITNAQFRRLPTALLKLNNLTSLVLDETKIEFWDTVILQHLAASLTSLTLTFTNVTQWPTWLTLFHSLTEITIEYDFITNIPDNAFSSLNNTLKEVNLGYNQLTQLPKAVLGLHNLISLDLSGNRFTDVAGRAGIEQLNLFPSALTLQTLTFKSAGLTTIPNFSNLTNLKEIYLSRNQISDSTTGSIPLSVSTLSLSFNKLASVPVFVANLSNLSYLDLSFNLIIEINFDLFPQNLTKLDLNYNKITKISDRIFTVGSVLETLDLSLNPISTISPQAFSNLTSLVHLYLDGTNITQVPLALTSLDKLRILSVGSTSLACPCPPSILLVQWYQSFNGHLSFFGFCEDQQAIDTYLSSSCQTSPSI